MDQPILTGDDAVLHNQLKSLFSVKFGIWMRAVSNMNHLLEFNGCESILALDSQSKISFRLCKQFTFHLIYTATITSQKPVNSLFSQFFPLRDSIKVNNILN